MRRNSAICLAVLLCCSPTADAQVVSLIVGSGQSGFIGIDSYAATNASYQGVYVTSTGARLSFFKYGGPSNNLFVNQIDSPAHVLQFNGHSGYPINHFVTQFGGGFCFGPDNNLYRVEGGSPNTIGKYDGMTGARIGTFVASANSGLESSAGGFMRFGSDGNLYVNKGNSITTDEILRFNGNTGAPLGAFTQPGSGALQAINDGVFASNGDLILSGINGTTNDTVWRFNGTTGAYLGIFSSGHGLDDPTGIAEGPDGRIYVASTFSDEIKRYDLASGAFIDDFVPQTAHQFPTYLAFSPYPIPEPSSLAFLGLASAGLAFLRRVARRRSNTRV